MLAEVGFRFEGASADEERTSIFGLEVDELVNVHFHSIRSRNEVTVIGWTFVSTFYMVIKVVILQQSVSGVCSITFVAWIIRQFAMGSSEMCLKFVAVKK